MSEQEKANYSTCLIVKNLIFGEVTSVTLKTMRLIRNIGKKGCYFETITPSPKYDTY